MNPHDLLLKIHLLLIHVFLMIITIIFWEHHIFNSIEEKFPNEHPLISYFLIIYG